MLFLIKMHGKLGQHTGSMDQIPSTLAMLDKPRWILVETEKGRSQVTGYHVALTAFTTGRKKGHNQALMHSSSGMMAVAPRADPSNKRS